MKPSDQPALFIGLGLVGAALPWAFVLGWIPVGGTRLALFGGIGLGVAFSAALSLVVKEPEAPAHGESFVGAGMARAQADRKKSIRTLAGCFVGTGYWLACRLAVIGAMVRAGDL